AAEREEQPARSRAIARPGDEERERDLHGADDRQEPAGTRVAPAALDERVRQPRVDAVEEHSGDPEDRDEPPAGRAPPGDPPRRRPGRPRVRSRTPRSARARA